MFLNVCFENSVFFKFCGKFFGKEIARLGTVDGTFFSHSSRLQV